MHKVIAVLSIMVAAQSLAFYNEPSEAQVIHLKQAHQAFFCAAMFSEYGTSPHYSSHLSEAGSDLMMKAEQYAAMYGMSQSGITHSKEAGVMQVIDLKAQHEYIPPSVETECIMIYRTVDAITSEQQQ